LAAALKHFAAAVFRKPWWKWALPEVESCLVGCGSWQASRAGLADWTHQTHLGKAALLSLQQAPLL